MKRVVGTLGPELKRPGREAEFNLPSSAEVKNEWSFTLPSPFTFMAFIGTTFIFFFISH